MDEAKRTADASRRLARADGLDPRVTFVIDVFRRNLSHPFNIAETSAAVRLSPSGFRRLFKQQIGCPIGKWQKNERLHAARGLLCATPLTVKEIFVAVGITISVTLSEISRSPLACHRLDFDEYEDTSTPLLCFAQIRQLIVKSANSTMSHSSESCRQSQ